MPKIFLGTGSLQTYTRLKCALLSFAILAGRQEGEAQLFSRLLALKFGPIPEDKQRLIESADSQKLRQWSERILTAQSMDEVLNDS